MASLVPPYPSHPPNYPLLVAFFGRMYQNDIEWAPSAFWQALCQIHFRIEDGFAAIAEQPPDDSRDSVDIMAYSYHPPSPFSMAKSATLEIKRASYSRQRLIVQTLRYASNALSRYQPPYILAMSIHNCDFMPWILRRGTRDFEPFFPHWPNFISIHSPEGELFSNFVNAIKDPGNLNHHRAISPGLWNVINATYLAGPSSSQDPEAQMQMQMQTDFEPEQQGDVQQDEPEEEDEPVQERSGVKVHVREERHRLRRNVYYFRDLEGSRIETTRNDWRREAHKCHRYRRDDRYWCPKPPT